MRRWSSPKDVETIYEVAAGPVRKGLDRIILKLLHLPETEARTAAWQAWVHASRTPKDDLTIHVVGVHRL